MDTKKVTVTVPAGMTAAQVNYALVKGCIYAAREHAQAEHYDTSRTYKEAGMLAAGILAGGH